jgi:glycosyltransferase involved in cell wall biosynthesis
LKLNELVSFYNLIDVLVLPSIDPLEAFGMVQVEALLCQTPVVASDMPGVREVVNKTGLGKIAEKRNSQDIAEKIIELKKRPVSITPAMLSEFDYSLCIDKYEEVLFVEG